MIEKYDHRKRKDFSSKNINPNKTGNLMIEFFVFFCLLAENKSILIQI